LPPGGVRGFGNGAFAVLFLRLYASPEDITLAANVDYNLIRNGSLHGFGGLVLDCGWSMLALLGDLLTGLLCPGKDIRAAGVASEVIPAQECRRNQDAHD